MGNEKLYGDNWIEIEYDKEYRWIYTNWRNIQTLTSIMNGGNMMLKFLKEKGCSKVLNDNRLVQGAWTFASDYTENEWFPAMVGAGLRHFAWISPNDVFSQFSIDRLKTIQSTGIIRLFDDIEEAKEWLKNCN